MTSTVPLARPRDRRPHDARPTVFAGARIVDPARGLDAVGSVIVAEGRILAAGPEVLNQGAPEGWEIVDARGKVIVPGFVDMRVFLGEPGHEHRETFASASRAAAAGGVTTIVTMPDTDPVIDDPALVDFVLRRAREQAEVRVHPMAALTKGLAGQETTEFGLLTEAGAVAFTDGRKSVASALVMRRALTYARDFSALIVHHVEEPTLAGAGVATEGEYASRLGLPGIPREAEAIMLERDMRLVALTGGRYHAAQVSTADSVEILRAAKARGLDVTAAVSINHLSLNELDIGTYRSFLKFSPPLRAEADRQAVIEGLAEGIIDIVVSSHDPQDVEMKRHPFAEAAEGAIGLETLLPAALRLVHDGRVSWTRLVEALSLRPADRLGLEAGRLTPGSRADLALIDPEVPWVLDRHELRSRSKNSPFEDSRFVGRVIRTLVDGRTIHSLSS
ncbi:dihydroorotase [Siculibacillus lacustris]|uniref:Dihydroorotase n=1 Tax=Siculibacillus lacustris TaxID=1549641 RepID=A0A4Q9VGX8_9HYPH|nr:dihydroorotase [Siculibacillus lacustris]TBW34294.1 dihydroorotase [Siculibacillus lacustris]